MPGRILARDGQAVPLTPKAFDTLVFLVERRDRVVRKTEMMAELWPDRAVEEANLTQQVSAVRKALGEGSEGERYIATIPRQGYRFTARVVSADPDAGTVRAFPPADRVAGSRQRPRQRFLSMATLAAGVGVAIALAGRLTIPHDRPAPHQGGIRSLAVLPFKDLSADAAQSFLADGITDSLISDLTRLEPLKVISFSSARRYVDGRKPVLQIARELGVDAVAQGSLARSGDRLRVTVRLLDGATDRELWSRTYDQAVADVLETEGDIARSIAQEMTITLTPEQMARLTKRRGALPAVQELYLRGRFYWNKRSSEGLEKAVSLFEEAIRREPTYAPAHAGLADCYAVMPDYGMAPGSEAFPHARDEAERALELDPDLGQAHATLARVLMNEEWDWAGAEREFQTALELNPGYATAHQWHAVELTALGRHDAALAEIRRARELDPMSPVVQANVGRALYYARNYDAAIRELREAAEMDPSQPFVPGMLAVSYCRTGSWREAFESADRVDALLKAPAYFPRAYVHATSGDSKEARRLLPFLEEQAHSRRSDAYWTAVLHSALGDTAIAVMWLEQAHRNHESMLVFLAAEPGFDPLRSDARFQALVKRLGLGAD